MKLTVKKRLLSVGYGRPPLIPLSHVKIEPCSHIAFSNVSDEVVSSSSSYFDAIMCAYLVKENKQLVLTRNIVAL